MRFEDCWPRLADVDLLLCSTAAPHPVVTLERVAPAVAARGDRPLCILDIALPRDVEPAVGSVDNVFLYNLDDLQSVVASSIERRRDELPVADAIISSEVERYWAWLAGLAAVPVLTQVRASMDTLREAELQTALRRMRNLTPEQQADLERFSKALLNKFLHGPSVRLRAAAANGRGLGIVDAARYLFGLDADPSKAADEPAATETDSNDT
jgi:glutamyl-tRNA reductase